MATITRGLGLVPISMSVLLVLAIILSYIISLTEHDVEPFLPSVSKTAAFQPQGSIFGQFLVTIAFVGFVNVFLRFLQVEMLTASVKVNSTGLIYRLRVASLSFGFATMVGVTIAGNFRFPRKEVRKLLDADNAFVFAFAIYSFVSVRHGINDDKNTVVNYLSNPGLMRPMSHMVFGNPE